MTGQQVSDVALWRVLVRRGLDAGVDLAGALAERFDVAGEPRAKLLRQRRRALRWGLLSVAAGVFWALLTAVLASWTVPFWVLIPTSAIAAVATIPATLLLLRYRWLRSLPLPAARPVATHRLPPAGSASRSAMAALRTSERGMFSLLGVIERGEMLPRNEVRDLRATAHQTATTMAATAREVVSMERTLKAAPHSRDQLAPTINAFTAQLAGGVRQYNEMVTAAAQLVSSANGESAAHSPMSSRRYRDELIGATDRLRGWAAAFDELAVLPRA